MALGRVTELGLNDVYKSMLTEKKVLVEGNDNDLIHSEIEEILNDFKSKISVEGVEEKIRDVEKYPALTAAEKSIIKSIQKVLDALQDLDKVEYSGIITMVGKTAPKDGESEIEAKDEEFAAKADEAPAAEEPPADGGFDFKESFDVMSAMLSEDKDKEI